MGNGNWTRNGVDYSSKKATVQPLTVNKATIDGRDTKVKQVTKWKKLNDGAYLCIFKVLDGKFTGRVFMGRYNGNKITTLKDADRAFIEEWYNKSVKISKLNFKVMSTTKKETTKKGAAKTTKTASKKATAKTASKKATAKKATAKAEKPKKEKKVGVIASIKEFVEAGPVKESALLKQLQKRFPDRAEDSMRKTIKAQIGSNKRPVRMERELAAKGVKWDLTIEVDEKSKEKTYSAKAK